MIISDIMHFLWINYSTEIEIVWLYWTIYSLKYVILNFWIFLKSINVTATFGVDKLLYQRVQVDLQ